MNKLLYDTLVHCHNNGDVVITFNRIKRLLSQSSCELEDDKKNFYSLFQLLKLGLIDSVGNNSFSLTPSSFIKYNRKKLTLGVNLPADVVIKNKNYIVGSYLGLTLFNHLHLDSVNYELLESEFNFESNISQLCTKNTIISNWNSIELQDIGKIEKIKKYDAIRHQWSTVAKFNNRYGLYKVYIHNQFNYYYLLCQNNKKFKIGKEEYEKINTLKLTNANNAFFKYNQEKKLLYLKNYFTYPIYLYKLLLLNHIMNTRTFPLNNQFKLNPIHFKKIVKIMSINYQMV